MFTGIIETKAKLIQITTAGSNKTFTFQSPMAHELKIDQSVSHNGVCLTIERIINDSYEVTAIGETLKVSNLDMLQTGDEVNIERCMQANGRFDGHFVQGHVDTIAKCSEVSDANGSWYFTFEFSGHQFAPLVVSKGSICVNGVSLTLTDVNTYSFRVAIIPYTFEHTNFSSLKQGDWVNIEFDIFGKYIQRHFELQK